MNHSSLKPCDWTPPVSRTPPAPGQMSRDAERLDVNDLQTFITTFVLLKVSFCCNDPRSLTGALRVYSI